MGLDYHERVTLDAKMQIGFDEPEFVEYQSFWKPPKQTPFADQVKNLCNEDTSNCKSAQTKYVYRALAQTILNDMGIISMTRLLKMFEQITKPRLTCVKRKVRFEEPLPSHM